MSTLNFKLDAAEAAIIEQILSSRDLCPSHPNEIAHLAHTISASLLPRLSKTLNHLRANQIHAAYLTGLPQFDGFAFDDRERLTKILGIFVSSMLGLPFQYEQQNDGQVAARVSPEKGFENTNSSLGSTEFGWHSDDSFLPGQYRTNWIALTGFLNRDHVLTKLSHVDAIAHELDATTLGVLLQPRFSLKIPVSFRLRSSGSAGEQIHSIPLLWFDSLRQLNISAAIYNTFPTQASDTDARVALEALNAAATRASQICDVQPGTILIFNNDKFLHGRNVIPGERVVFRTYIKPCLAALRSAGEAHDAFVFDLHKIIGKMNAVNGALNA